MTIITAMFQQIDRDSEVVKYSSNPAASVEEVVYHDAQKWLFTI